LKRPFLEPVHTKRLAPAASGWIRRALVSSPASCQSVISIAPDLKDARCCDSGGTAVGALVKYELRLALKVASGGIPTLAKADGKMDLTDAPELPAAQWMNPIRGMDA